MKKLLAVALIAAFSSASWAQKASNQAFDILDKNRDGFLSKEEVAGNKELAKRFAKFDANKDGKMSVDEFIKANEDNDKRIASDSAITTKVKTKFLTEKGIPSMAISVETYEGIVLLTGTVGSKDQIATAGKLVAGVPGVKKVDNKLAAK